MAIIAILSLSGCTAGSSKASPASSAGQAEVHLVAATAELGNECAAAADALGFAVPCPAQVPSIDGRAMTCPPLVGAATSPCVGSEGLPPYHVFALDFSGFDVPAGYFGVDGNPVGHIAIEARPHNQSPPSPCVGAVALGPVIAGSWTTAAFNCSNDTLEVQRAAMHGEGTYAGHTMLAWSQDGIDYIVSAHGQTTVNRDLLVRLVNATTLTPPSQH
jgi:hypothetical protein